MRWRCRRDADGARWRAELSRCAAERALRDHRSAIATDTLLDLVRHACPLTDHVGGDLVMPVRSCPAEHVHCAFIRPDGQVGLILPSKWHVDFVLRLQLPATAAVAAC